METAKALYAIALLAVLALAAADVRTLYQTPGGADPRRPSADTAPLDSARASAGTDGVRRSSGSSASGDFQTFSTGGQRSEFGQVFNPVPQAGRVSAVAGQDSKRSSLVEDVARFSLSQSLGQQNQQGPSSQFAGAQFGQQAQDFSGADFRSFPTLFQGDITRPLTPESKQEGDGGFSSQFQDVDASGRPATSQPRQARPVVQQQDGGIMFTSEGQRDDGSADSAFSSLAADAGLRTDAFSNAFSSGGVRLITDTDQLLAPAQVTITKEVTIDRFTTLTNLAYNSVPVTLTEFIKVTVTAPTFQAITTPVDDLVLVSRVPVSRTDTITVTDTSSGHQYATEVSTVRHTITHKLYDIRQQTVTSLVVQTQLVRPRIVSTHIETEYETQTQLQTVTNTVFLDPQVPRGGPLPAPLPSRYGFYQ